jgi:Mn-dependent DtxR family transcriptional regulator
MMRRDGRDDSLDLVVAELALQSVRASEIARRIGVTPNRVYSVLHYLRRHGAELPRVKSGPSSAPQGARLPRLSGELRAALAPYAAARQMSVKALSVQILQIVARDGLVDAIIDDEEPRP